MFHIVLWEPEIPPNTGNIARLCVATGAMLHLVGRLGFRLDNHSLRRAGVDCWSELQMQQHATLNEFESSCAPMRLYCFTARGHVPYTSARYRDGDYLMFGGESHGLPDSLLQRHAVNTLCIPMPSGKVRSLNLATAVGIVLYEALRQRHNW